MERKFFSNINLLLNFEYIVGAETGCLELDRLFSFSVERFYLTNICYILMPVDFPLKVLSVRNKLMDFTNKLKYLFFNLMKIYNCLTITEPLY